jgi:twinkle protein
MGIQENITAGTADGTAPSSRISPARQDGAQKRARDQPETLALLGVASGTAFFPDLSRKSEAVFFPFKDGWKARAYPDKSFVAGGGFKLSFWNLERVLKANPERGLHR